MDELITFNVAVSMHESAIINTALGFGWTVEVIDEANTPVGGTAVMIPNPIAAQDYCMDIARDRIIQALTGMSKEAGTNILTAQKEALDTLIDDQVAMLANNVTITQTTA